MARVRSETGAAVRRVVSRGLLVAGGVVAGTAAAWLLSSATASAETQPHPGLGSAHLSTVDTIKAVQHDLTENPLAHTATKAVKDVDHVVDTTVQHVTKTVHVSTVVNDLGSTLRAEPTGKPSGLSTLGSTAKGAFDDFGAGLADKFGWPRVGDQVDVPSNDVPPAAGGQPGDTSPIVGPAVHAPVAGPRAVPADTTTAPAVQDRQRMGGLNRGSPLPAPAPLNLPVSPFPAPIGSSGHSSSTGGSLDGPTFGALPLNGFRTLFAVFGTSRPAVAGAPVHTGAQPGNTPD